MKRLVAALVVGALLLPVTVGCGNPSSPAKPSTSGTSSKEKEKTGTAPESKAKTNP